MSNVDEKVVSLKFDNDNFEQNADKSIGTLERLRKSIDFTNHTKGGKGLEELNQTIKASDLNGMEKGVNTIAERFTNLGIVGVTALQNITNKAVDAGERLVKSLTIDPIKSGLNEYELKMGSMRTILASTRSEFKNEAEAIQKINEHLNELNKYSDDTIYSFSDMTNNIGKFTNAGVKLDVAVQAIKGISNEAAISGANANEASRAMYNFSQALSAGYVKLIDWKSIENANMATKEFKEQLIETAVATGDLTKKGDMYVTSKGKEITATKNFNDSLQDGWMTTKVLTTTLNNYATDVTRMSAAEKQAYEEKLKSIGYTDEQIKKIEETGTKAYEAAAEVTTWSKLVDTLQEAVQSGWAQTFELLFGNIKEATQLWTGISLAVSKFIDVTSSARNVMLKEWKEAGGRTAILNGLANVLKYIGSLLKPIGVAFRAVFPPASGKALAEASKRFEALTKTLKPSEATIRNIRDAFIGFFSVIRLGKNIVVGLVKAIIPAGSAGSSLGRTFFALAGSVGRVLSSLVALVEQSGVLKFVFSTIEGAVTIVTKVLSNFANFIEQTLTPMINGITSSGEGNPFTKLADDIQNLGKASSNLDALTKPVESLKDALSDLSESKTYTNIKQGFADAFGQIEAGNLSTVLFQIIKVLGLAALVKKMVSGFGKDSLLSVLKKPFESTAGVLDQLKETFLSIGDAFGSIGGVLKAAKRNLQANALKSLAASILMLTASVYLLSRISKKDMNKALGALTFISLLFLALARLSSSDSIDPKSLLAASTAFVAVGTSLVLLSVAARLLGSMDGKGLAKAGIAIAAFILGVTKITTIAKGSIKGALSFAVIAGSIGAGLTLLTPSILILSKMSIGGMLKAAAAIVSFIVLITRAADLAGKNKINTLQFMGISIAISLLVPAIIALAKLPFIGALKAAAGIALIVIAIGKSAEVAGQNKISAVSFIAISVAVSLLAPAMAALAAIPFGKALQSALMLAAILTILTTAINKVNSGGLKSSLGNSAIFLVLAVSIRMLAGAFLSLSKLSFGDIVKSITAMTGCIVSLSLAGKLAKGASAKVLLIAATIGVLGIAIRTFDDVDASKALMNMVGVSALISSVAITCSLVSKIPLKAAIAGIAKFAIFLAGITAITAALGALASKWDNFEKYLKKGAKIGALLGEFIGGFLGNLVGSFVGGLSSGLVVLGKNLSAFMTELEPFLDGLDSITPETANSVKNLAKAILYLTAAELVDSLNSFPTNAGGTSSGMVTFAQQLGVFLDELKPLGDKASDIPNLEALNKVSKTITVLAKAAMEIPSVGGIRGIINGVKDLGLFGTQLGTFVETLTNMKENNFVMGKTDMNSILNIAKTVRELGAAANEIPAVGGIKDIIYGVKDIGSFATQLTDFAPKFSEFMTAVNAKDSGITTGGLEKVTAMANTVKHLAIAADKIPRELDGDSIDAAINGVKDLPKFADGMVEIGNKIPSLISASEGMNEDAEARIIRMANVIKKMAQAAKSIHNIDKDGKGGYGAETRSMLNKLAKFTDNMSGYVKGFKNFAEKAGEIKDEDLNAANKVSSSINKMAKAANTMSKIKSDANKNIKQTLTDMADGLAEYAKKVNGLEVGNLESNTAALKSSITSATKALKGGSKSAKSSATSAIKAYVKGLSSAAKGESGAGAAAASVRKAALEALNKTSGFGKAGTASATKYANALKKAKGVKSAGESMGKKGAKGAKDVSFYSAGKSAAEGFANGLQDPDTVASVASAGTSLGNAAYKAAKEAIESKSPSRKFMRLGRFASMGMAIGIEQYSDKVYAAGKSIGDTSIKGAKDSLADIDSLLSDPSITPVLDLSEVKRGADQINGILGNSANINTGLIASTVNSQNRGRDNSVLNDKLDKLVSSLYTIEAQPKTNYNIGDVTLDVRNLDNVLTLEGFVDVLKRAKSFA